MPHLQSANALKHLRCKPSVTHTMNVHKKNGLETTATPRKQQVYFLLSQCLLPLHQPFCPQSRQVKAQHLGKYIFLFFWSASQHYLIRSTSYSLFSLAYQTHWKIFPIISQQKSAFISGVRLHVTEIFSF